MAVKKHGYTMNIEEFLNDGFCELERISEAGIAHCCTVTGNSKEDAARKLCERLHELVIEKLVEEY